MLPRGTERQPAGSRVGRAVEGVVGAALLLLGGFLVFWGTCLAAAWGIHPDITTGFRIFLGVLISLLALSVSMGGWALVRVSR
jgi:hypothetical protein